MSDWNSFLLTQGAFTDSEGNVDFPQPEFNDETTYLMPLSQQGLLSIKGPDTCKFLQGQITCDVNELENHTTRIGAQCNIKGRMLLCFRALQLNPEQVILRINRDLIANGLQSLGKYIVFSKAKLADITPDYRCLGIAGPNASSIIKDVLGINIDADDEWRLSGNNIVIRLNEHRYECWLAVDEAKREWQKLSVHCDIAGQNFWTLLNIQSGFGDITIDTFETFTPQAINLQYVNGINFRKGCYTGQEIVARLHYRGNLKRHMYRFEFVLEDNKLPSSGSELENSEGKKVGEVVLSALRHKNVGELLANVADDQCLNLYLPNRREKLSLLSLPYAIPTQDITH